MRGRLHEYCECDLAETPPHPPRYPEFADSRWKTRILRFFS
jgi:hypothetical protein